MQSWMPSRKLTLKMSLLRKKNSKRPIPPWSFYLLSTYRKIVETDAGLIERVLPKSIRSVTGAGFKLKVVLLASAALLAMQQYSRDPG
jgi:hypothetical protein